MAWDKEGAIMLVARDEDHATQIYHTLQHNVRAARRTKVPKKPSAAFRFAAWTVGMPPTRPLAIEKRCTLRPEDTWYDGLVWHYKERDAQFRWISRGLASSTSTVEEEEDDDDDDDDDDEQEEEDDDDEKGCGGKHCRGKGGNRCKKCARMCLEWRQQQQAQDYYARDKDNGPGFRGRCFTDKEGRVYDYLGHRVQQSDWPREVAYSSYPAEDGEGADGNWPDSRRRRAAMRTASPSPMREDDVDNTFIRRDGPGGRPVRYSQRPPMKVYEQPTPGVEKYRWG